MGAAIYSILGSIWALVSVILLLFIILGSVSTTAVLRDLWFIKLDFSDIGKDLITGLSGLSSSDVTKLRDYKFFTMGLWNYCYWGTDGNIMGCTKPSTGFYFTIDEIVYNIFDFHVDTNEIPNLNMSAVKSRSQVAVVFFGIAIAVSVIAFIVSVISVFRSKTARKVATGFALLSCICYIAPTVAVWLNYFNINDKITKPSGSELSIKSNIGKPLLALSLVSVFSSLVSFIFSFISVFKSRSLSRSGYEGEAAPFLGDVPLASYKGNKNPPSSYAYSVGTYDSRRSLSSYSSNVTGSTYYDPGPNERPREQLYSGSSSQTAGPVTYDLHTKKTYLPFKRSSR